MKTGFNSQEYEDEQFVDQFEADVKSSTTSYIKKTFRDIDTNLLRRFNSEFKQDEYKKERNWITLEEKAIDELWIKVRASCDNIFPKFSYIEIEFNTKNMSFGETPGQDP